MNSLKALIRELSPNGVTYSAIELVCDFNRGKWIKADQLVSGPYPVVTSGQKVTEFHNEFNRSGESITIASSGAYAGFINFWNQEIYLSNAFTADPKNPKHLLPKFLFYILKDKQNYIHGLASGGGVPNVYGHDLNGLRIPLPPLEVQLEVVRILDKFIELEAGLEEELEARIIQRNFVIDAFQSGELPRLKGAIQIPLMELVHFENGRPHEPLVDPEGDCELITAKFIASNGTLARRINKFDIRTLARVNDVTIVLSDLPNGKALAKCFFVQRDNFFGVNQRIAILRSKDVTIADPEYLYHFVNRNPQILKFDDGSTQTHLKKANVVDMVVHLPDIETQRKIANELTALEKFVFATSESLPAEIAARRRQYEYYRNKLLTFKETEVA